MTANSPAADVEMPPLPLDVAPLRSDAIVYDIITHPHDTALLRALHQHQCIDEAEFHGLGADLLDRVG